jgi:xanthine dehydrogenase YagS FAD-binding subunit
MLLELPSFEHIDVKSVKEAVFWLQKYGEKAKIIAGATDLLGLMKDRIEGPELKIPEVLVNIKTIPDLKRITDDQGAGLKIGAAVTLNQLETSEVLRRKFDILLQAAQQIGTTPIRNMATIGGNICQRPRCVYFRHPDFLCYKKGGAKCFAVIGEHRYFHSILRNGKCFMANTSDMATALVALRAEVIIASSEGEKELPLKDFFLGPDHLAETILKPDELLTAIRVPDRKESPISYF